SSAVVVDDLFVEFKLSEFINLSTDSWHGEVTARRGEECFPAYLSVASLTGHNDSVLNLMTCQDITELQAFNTTIRELEKYSSAQEAAVELAHDLKNMLAVLLGNVDLVLSRLSEDQRSKSERAIEAIAEAARETSQYVENVMAFREERGEFLPVNLVTIARAVTRFCRLQGRFRHIKLDCSVSEDFPRLLHVREGQIQSVILNLLINAAEALSESEDTSSRAIDLGLSADESENRVVITVSDNGPGIDSTYLPKVFSEQFTTKERGHGIGLVSVARIVRSHGGDVSVDTHPGQGAKFTVTLPIMREPGDA
ncbi:MAG: ATP-binding protein, partial [Candidatus Zixiibacteriota bacterium]